MSYTPPPEDPNAGSWQTPPAAPPPGGFSSQPGFPPQPGAYPPQAGGYPPQPGAYPPQPGYGAPMSQDHPQGTTILVLGILSLVVCGILGPFAWVMGNKAIKEIDASPGRYSNRGQVQAGRICGAIASVLLILGVVFVIVAIAIGASTSTSTY